MALQWSPFLSLGDLRLLIAIYSIAILVLAGAVDERKRVNQELAGVVTALKDSEQRFATAFYNAPVVLVISSPEDCRMLEVNDTFLERTGFSRSEVLGKTPVDLGITMEEKRGQILREIDQKWTSYRARSTVRNEVGRVGAVPIQRHGRFDRGCRARLQ